jgi:hypothetical protein
MIRHRAETLWLAPELLQHGVHVGRELSYFANEPLERARGRRAEHLHEPPWRARRTTRQQNETRTDDTNTCEQRTDSRQVPSAAQHAGAFRRNRQPFSGRVHHHQSNDALGIARGVRANHEAAKGMADQDISLARCDTGEDRCELVDNLLEAPGA